MPTSLKSPSVSKRVYRAAVVGCGRIGCAFDDKPLEASVNTHSGAYLETPGFELVALADLDGGKLERYRDKFDVRAGYADAREMFERESIDVVSICTPNHTHREIAEYAVAAGVKAVFCEKPLADSLSSADAMIARCREAGVLLMVDHKRRFDRFHREVGAFLQAGGLGEVQQVTCYYTAGLANTAVHLLDLLQFFFGDVAWVRGWGSPCRSPNPHDPNIDGFLQFRDGPSVAIQACDVKHYVVFEVNILGAGGRLRIMASGHDVAFERVGDSDKFPGHHELFPADPPVDAGGRREFMLQAAAHLFACLESGGSPIATGEDGRRAMELICGLRESADDDGRRIELPLADSHVTIQSR